MSTDLLRLREFIADLARLAEAIVMYDADESAWAARNSLSSREVTAWFAPTRIGSRTEKPAAKAEQCEVRAQAAEWIAQLKQKYGATLVEWIDTGVDTEKPALVLKMRVVLESEEKRDVVLVAWRGSKTWQDWYYTDFSCRALRLQHDPKQRAWRSSATDTSLPPLSIPSRPWATERACGHVLVLRGSPFLQQQPRKERYCQCWRLDQVQRHRRSQPHQQDHWRAEALNRSSLRQACDHGLVREQVRRSGQA